MGVVLTRELRTNRSVLGGFLLVAVLTALLVSMFAAPSPVALSSDDMAYVVGGRHINYSEAAGWMVVAGVVVAVVAVAIAPPILPAVFAGFGTVASLGAADAVVGAVAFGLYKLSNSRT